MLKASKLSCGYGKILVLDQIDFEIKKSEIFCFIGLNGAGKSTLLRTLLGLIETAHGEIQIDGKNLTKLSMNDRAKKLSMLESHPFAPFSISVAELFEIQTNKNTALQEKAINKLEVNNFLNQNLLTLSAGQAKRVWLAHTLSLGTEIILIDEPFLHLDWLQQKKFSQTMLDWKREIGTTFVLAAHELELTASFADKLCAIHNKEILIQDSPEKVLTSPALSEVFAFKALIDQNPIDGSKRITLGFKK